MPGTGMKYIDWKHKKNLSKNNQNVELVSDFKYIDIWIIYNKCFIEDKESEHVSYTKSRFAQYHHLLQSENFNI